MRSYPSGCVVVCLFTVDDDVLALVVASHPVAPANEVDYNFPLNEFFVNIFI